MLTCYTIARDVFIAVTLPVLSIFSTYRITLGGRRRRLLVPRDAGRPQFAVAPWGALGGTVITTACILIY